MSQEKAPIKTPEATRQFVVFVLADTEFGMDIKRVREVIRVPSMTRVPRTPDYIEGVINLRGRILPVFDLKKRFNLPSTEVTPNTRIMIVEWMDQSVGMLVDKVEEVLRVPAAGVSKPPEMILTIAGKFLEGIVEVRNRLLILLDMERILSPEELGNWIEVETGSGEANRGG